MADLGFPRGGGANSPGGCQHVILPNFPKNCMKLKEFGPRGGGRASKILLCRSTTAWDKKDYSLNAQMQLIGIIQVNWGSSFQGHFEVNGCHLVLLYICFMVIPSAQKSSGNA